MRATRMDLRAFGGSEVLERGQGGNLVERQRPGKASDVIGGVDIVGVGGERPPSGKQLSPQPGVPGAGGTLLALAFGRVPQVAVIVEGGFETGDGIGVVGELRQGKGLVEGDLVAVHPLPGGLGQLEQGQPPADGLPGPSGALGDRRLGQAQVEQLLVPRGLLTGAEKYLILLAKSGECGSGSR